MASRRRETAKGLRFDKGGSSPHVPYRLRPQVRLSRYSDMKEKLEQASNDIVVLTDEVAYWRSRFVENLVSDVVALRQRVACCCQSDRCGDGDLVIQLDEMLAVMRRLVR